MRSLRISVFSLCAYLLFCGTSRGQWLQTNGPYGGPISNLVAAGPNLFATGNSSLFLSTDRGNHWSRFQAPGAGPYVHENDVFFLNSPYDSYKSYCYHSSNYGATWDTTVDSLDVPFLIGSIWAANGNTLLMG